MRVYTGDGRSDESSYESSDESSDESRVYPVSNYQSDEEQPPKTASVAVYKASLYSNLVSNCQL